MYSALITRAILLWKKLEENKNKNKTNNQPKARVIISEK